jgi:hypothetical protein
MCRTPASTCKRRRPRPVATDAKFPLRYREIVGEYFKAIAESDDEQGKK